MKRLVAIALLTVASGAVLAQDPPMGASAEMKQLEWWVGEWAGKLTWDVPGMGKQEGTYQMNCEMFGQFMRSASVMDIGDGILMNEIGYTGWDAKNKRYTTHTFSNFAPTPRIEHGTIESQDTFVSVSEPWDAPGMPSLVGRGTLVKRGDKQVLFTLEFKQGDAWVKVAEGLLAKK